MTLAQGRREVEFGPLGQLVSGGTSCQVPNQKPPAPGSCVGARAGGPCRGGSLLGSLWNSVSAKGSRLQGTGNTYTHYTLPPNVHALRHACVCQGTCVHTYAGMRACTYTHTHTHSFIFSFSPVAMFKPRHRTATQQDTGGRLPRATPRLPASVLLRGGSSGQGLLEDLLQHPDATCHF